MLLEHFKQLICHSLTVSIQAVVVDYVSDVIFKIWLDSAVASVVHVVSLLS